MHPNGAAKTYAEPVPITADLPVLGQETPPATQPRSTGPQLPATRHDSTLSAMRGASRKGVWELGEKHTAFALMAGIDLDLRQARFTSRETVIYAHAIWGGIDIMVNEYTHGVVDGVGIMGGYDHAADKAEPQLGPDSPVVRVKGVALMAGVTVQRKPMPRPPGSRRRLGR